MAKLWKALIEMYGHKFISAYGDVPSETWSLALSGCGWEQLSAGIKACFKREDTWPPTLPEFVEMCKPQVSSLYFHSPALPPPENISTPEYALEQLKEIKRKLNSSTA